MLSALASNEFYGKAILNFVYAINIIPFPVASGLYPFKILYDFIPDHSSLKVVNSTCFVFHPQVEHIKLSYRFAICVFLGYRDGQKGIVVMILNQENFMFPVMFYFLNTFLFSLFLFILILLVVQNSPILSLLVLMIIFLVIVILRTACVLTLLILILTSILSPRLPNNLP